MSLGEDIDTGDVSGAARTPCFGESAAEGGGGGADRLELFEPRWFTGFPSGKHTKSYRKWPFIVNLPIKNSDFHSKTNIAIENCLFIVGLVCNIQLMGQRKPNKPTNRTEGHHSLCGDE